MSSEMSLAGAETGAGRFLIVVASEGEARAVASGAGGTRVGTGSGGWVCERLTDGVDMLVTGVGKSNAAAGTALVLSRGCHRGVLSVGIAGALPGCGIRIGDAASIRAAVLADEGVRTGRGFEDIASMGFAPVAGRGVVFEASASVRGVVERVVGASAVVATVSTCSGTDALAEEVAARTGAWLEDMETASIAVVCERMGVAWGGVRVVSNTTGERERQRWDVAGALAGLGSVIGRVVGGTGPDAL